ncbi:MAG: S41 family peptidase [Clostridia bacterium]|nr:S41 family peptidase [Clostridia bacterium]
MKKQFSLVFAVVLTAILTFTFTAGGFVLAILFAEDDRVSRSLSEIRDVIDTHAVFEFSEEEAELAAIRAYLSGLDDSYTQFWTKEEYEAQLSSNEGHYTGIGITLQSEQTIRDGLFIRRVLGNSPAEQAGLKAGDLIVAINGISVIDRDYNQVYEEMGLDAGESLNFTVSRGNETLSIDVTFQNFVQSYVSWRMIGSVGFIRIHAFNAPAAEEFQRALNDLLSQGAKGFVFDLRNNLGGSLDAVKNILELLIPKGEEMVVIQYKNSEEIFYSESEQKTDLPMVVLINGSSASGSELMASCLRDVNGSVLIGTRSYGKGIGQTTFRLSDDSAVKITTFHYLTKARNNYHGIGLEPDETVTLSEEQEKYFYALDESDDPQLQAALSHLETQIFG